jgi:hypothetical protein
MPYYTIETIRDEGANTVTVRGTLALGDAPDCHKAALAYLQEFGYNPATGVIDIGGTPVTVAVAGDDPELQAVAVTENAFADEFQQRAAVENVMLNALEIRRIYTAVKAAEENA